MKRLALGVAAAMIAPAVLASPNFDSSIYVAAEFTHTNFDISKSDFPAFSLGGTTFVPTDVESRDTGTQFLIGIRPHRNLSVDIGHVDFGEASVTYQPYDLEEEASADGLVLGVNALFPMHHQVTFFARAGVLYCDLDNELSVVGTTVATADDDGSDLFIGAGLWF